MQSLFSADSEYEAVGNTERSGNEMRRKNKRGRKQRTRRAGLICMYFGLMVDFISTAHCYAWPVLLQQNEYCILMA